MRHRDFSEKALPKQNLENLKNRDAWSVTLTAIFGEVAQRDRNMLLSACGAFEVWRWRKRFGQNDPGTDPVVQDFVAHGFRAFIRGPESESPLFKVFLWPNTEPFLVELMRRAEAALEGDPGLLKDFAQSLATVCAAHRTSCAKGGPGDVGNPVLAVLSSCIPGSTRTGFRQTRVPTARWVQEQVKLRRGYSVHIKTIQRIARRLGVKLEPGTPGRPKKPRPKKPGL